LTKPTPALSAIRREERMQVLTARSNALL